MSAAIRFLVFALAVALSGSALALLGYLDFDLSPIPKEVDESAREAEPDPPRADDTARVPEVTLAPREAFAVVIDRPLFGQSRRPGAAALSTASDAGSGEIGALLVGVIFSEVGSIAMLQPEDDDTLLRLQEGDRLNGWELASIEPQSVLFRRDGEETLLSLDFSSGWDERRAREPRRPAQRAASNQDVSAEGDPEGDEFDEATEDD